MVLCIVWARGRDENLHVENGILNLILKLSACSLAHHTTRGQSMAVLTSVHCYTATLDLSFTEGVTSEEVQTLLW